MGLRIGDILRYIGDFKVLKGLEATVIKLPAGISGDYYEIEYDAQEVCDRLKKTIYAPEYWPFWAGFKHGLPYGEKPPTSYPARVDTRLTDWVGHRSIAVEELLLSDNPTLQAEGKRRARHQEKLMAFMERTK